MGKTIAGYKVDGWSQEQNCVYEFHGCVWHGCPRVSTKKEIRNFLVILTLPWRKHTSAPWKKRINIENLGYTFVELWECKLRKQMKKDKMQAFFAQCEIESPMDPKEAFLEAVQMQQNFITNARQVKKSVMLMSVHYTLRFVNMGFFHMNILKLWQKIYHN